MFLLKERKKKASKKERERKKEAKKNHYGSLVLHIDTSQQKAHEVRETWESIKRLTII